jgi:lipoprotein-anchoring transpeptidase ErfK/SrfK
MVRSLKYSHPEANKEYVSIVSIHDQRLYLYKNGEPYREYPVSTSRFGIGNQDGSHQTPLGLHRIVGKIGEGEPLGAIFKARKPTGEIARIFKSKITMPYDQVTSRILRLEGLEPGINKGTGIDTFERYICIHGTHEEGLIGQPASIGCVRMTNRDVIELFGEIPENSLVLIIEGAKDQAVLAGDHRDQSATN